MCDIFSDLKDAGSCGCGDVNSIRELVIQDIKFSIEEVDPQLWSSNSMGCVHSKESKILIDKNMNRDVMDATLLHEIIHVISDMNSLNLNETEVSVLATGLHPLYKLGV